MSDNVLLNTLFAARPPPDGATGLVETVGAGNPAPDRAFAAVLTANLGESSAAAEVEPEPRDPGLDLLMLDDNAGNLPTGETAPVAAGNSLPAAEPAPGRILPAPSFDPLPGLPQTPPSDALPAAAVSPEDNGPKPASSNAGDRRLAFAQSVSVTNAADEVLPPDAVDEDAPLRLQPADETRKEPAVVRRAVELPAEPDLPSAMPTPRVESSTGGVAVTAPEDRRDPPPPEVPTLVAGPPSGDDATTRVRTSGDSVESAVTSSTDTTSVRSAAPLDGPVAPVVVPALADSAVDRSSLERSTQTAKPETEVLRLDPGARRAPTIPPSEARSIVTPVAGDVRLAPPAPDPNLPSLSPDRLPREPLPSASAGDRRTSNLRTRNAVAVAAGGMPAAVDAEVVQRGRALASSPQPPAATADRVLGHNEESMSPVRADPRLATQPMGEASAGKVARAPQAPTSQPLPVDSARLDPAIAPQAAEVRSSDQIVRDGVDGKSQPSRLGGIDFLDRNASAADQSVAPVTSGAAGSRATAGAAESTASDSRFAAVETSSRPDGAQSTARDAQAEVLSAIRFRPAGATDVAAAARFTSELGDRIAYLQSRGVSRATIHLEPADLGRIEIQLQLRSEQTNVQFAAQHSAIRDLIEAQLPRLRTMMEEQGLSLGDVDVGQQSPEHGAAQSREPAERWVTAAADIGAPPPPQSVPQSRGLVDAYA